LIQGKDWRANISFWYNNRVPQLYKYLHFPTYITFIFYFYNAYFINFIFLFISDLLSTPILSTISDLVAKSQQRAASHPEHYHSASYRPWLRQRVVWEVSYTTGLSKMWMRWPQNHTAHNYWVRLARRHKARAKKDIPSTKPLGATQHKTGAPSNCQLLEVERQKPLNLITSLLRFFKNAC
jgi:hypothetical protein